MLERCASRLDQNIPCNFDIVLGRANLSCEGIELPSVYAVDAREPYQDYLGLRRGQPLGSQGYGVKHVAWDGLLKLDAQSLFHAQKTNKLRELEPEQICRRYQAKDEARIRNPKVPQTRI